MFNKVPQVEGETSSSRLLSSIRAIRMLKVTPSLIRGVLTANCYCLLPLYPPRAAGLSPICHLSNPGIPLAMSLPFAKGI